MHITLNGEQASFPDGSSIEQMLESLKLEPRKIAVERNLEIVPRSLYNTTFLTEGDQVEIVHFIGGGAR